MKSYASCVFLVAAVSGRALEGGNLEFERGEYSVKVTGNQNVPKYIFSSIGDDGEESTTYKIQYKSLYEADDNMNKVGSNTYSLSSLTWSIEEDSSDDSVFWIRNTGANGNKDLPWTNLEFKNTLFNDTVKFDVILDGYQWDSDDAEYLAFTWKMTEETDAETAEDGELDESGEGDAPVEEETDQLCFGDSGVCFNIEDTAQATGADDNVVDVAVTLDFAADEGIVVYYERFVGDLVHDPSFGFVSTDDCSGIFGALLCFLRSIFNFLFGWL